MSHGYFSLFVFWGIHWKGFTDLFKYFPNGCSNHKCRKAILFLTTVPHPQDTALSNTGHLLFKIFFFFFNLDTWVKLYWSHYDSLFLPFFWVELEGHGGLKWIPYYHYIINSGVRNGGNVRHKSSQLTGLVLLCECMSEC